MAFVFKRLCACLLLSLAACTAPRPSETPSAPSQPGPTVSGAALPSAQSQPISTQPQSPQPSAAADTQAAPVSSAQAPLPDAKPDENGWGVAAGLRYLEIVRGGASPEAKLPMLIVMHGLGDKPSRNWVNAIDLDPGLKARMILPQAPTPYGPGFAWFPYRFRDQNEVALAQGIHEAESGLMRAIEQLTRLRPTRGRVIATGFSQGGMLSFALALAHPQQFQLALPISGMLPHPLWPASKPTGYLPRIVALHGNADPVVSFDADAQLVEHLRGLHFPAEIAAFEGVGHQIDPAMSARVRQELSAAVKAAKH